MSKRWYCFFSDATALFPGFAFFLLLTSEVSFSWGAVGSTGPRAVTAVLEGSDIPLSLFFFFVFVDEASVSAEAVGISVVGVGAMDDEGRDLECECLEALTESFGSSLDLFCAVSTPLFAEASFVMDDDPAGGWSSTVSSVRRLLLPPAAAAFLFFPFTFKAPAGMLSVVEWTPLREVLIALASERWKGWADDSATATSTFFSTDDSWGSVDCSANETRRFFSGGAESSSSKELIFVVELVAIISGFFFFFFLFDEEMGYIFYKDIAWEVISDTDRWNSVPRWLRGRWAVAQNNFHMDERSSARGCTKRFKVIIYKGINPIHYDEQWYWASAIPSSRSIDLPSRSCESRIGAEYEIPSFLRTTSFIPSKLSSR